MYNCDTQLPVLDFVGIGFGPANLANAIAVKEAAPRCKGLFFESENALKWHENFIFGHSYLQISYLKDLVTLRNPQSPYSFISYLKDVGRLEEFANLRTFHPHRREYLGYLRWAAASFADQVRYESRVTNVTHGVAGHPDYFLVTAEHVLTGERTRVHARNLIVATGGKPRLVEGCRPGSTRVMHATDFAARMPKNISCNEEHFRVLVAGDGQSAAEIVLEILTKYKNAVIDLLARGPSLRTADSTPFINRTFSMEESLRFHAASPEKRDAILREVRSTNYGVVDETILTEIHRLLYLEQVNGWESRLRIHEFARLEKVVEPANGEGPVVATVRDRVDDRIVEQSYDAVVLAIGYDRQLDEKVLGHLFSKLEKDQNGFPVTNAEGAAVFKEPTAAQVYLHGIIEQSHGIGDSLLSLLAVRSGMLARHLAANLDPLAAPVPDTAARGTQHPPSQDYPPRRHLENDESLQLEVIRRHPFATLSSSSDSCQPMVSELPLTLLDTPSGRRLLFGHLDRNNPQAAGIDGRNIVAVFQGTDSFISPTVYLSDQLPTWNSVSVHVRGRVRVISGRDEIVCGMQKIVEGNRSPGDGYMLRADDPRIDQLIGGIVAFEIEVLEMVGRFKLSQDRDEGDRLRAVKALCEARKDYRDVIDRSLDALMQPAPTKAGQRRFGYVASG